MEIMLKNKCCLYVIISIRFFSFTICNLLIEFPSYKRLDSVLIARLWQISGLDKFSLIPDQGLGLEH